MPDDHYTDLVARLRGADEPPTMTFDGQIAGPILGDLRNEAADTLERVRELTVKARRIGDSWITVLDIEDALGVHDA